jgi:hypothetical protein
MQLSECAYRGVPAKYAHKKFTHVQSYDFVHTDKFTNRRLAIFFLSMSTVSWRHLNALQRWDGPQRAQVTRMDCHSAALLLNHFTMVSSSLNCPFLHMMKFLPLVPANPERF